MGDEAASPVLTTVVDKSLLPYVENVHYDPITQVQRGEIEFFKELQVRNNTDLCSRKTN